MANKTINGKQFTIVWHVDNLKISHESSNVVTSILSKLDKKYGQEIVDGERAKLSITREKIHDYLGIILDYKESGAVKIDMTEYIEKNAYMIYQKKCNDKLSPQKLTTYTL